jgi:hypothetical protein
MSTLTPNWTIEKFREELQKLDDEHGLVGAQTEIILRNVKTFLGYCWFQVGNRTVTKPPKRFEFSLKYFNSPDFPEQVAIDVIRHEYAHHYAHVVFGSTRHDWLWKKACVIVGANPKRLYNPKEWEWCLSASKMPLIKSKFIKGAALQHKFFGSGTVLDINDSTTHTPILTVQFATSVKRLDESWVLNNCIF